MDTVTILTIAILMLFIHLMIIVLFSKFIVGHEPANCRRVVYFALLMIAPFLGAWLVYKFLKLNWFRNEDGSKRSGAISIDFLELDAIFNPGSKQRIEERRREKQEARKEGEKYHRD